MAEGECVGDDGPVKSVRFSRKLKHWTAPNGIYATSFKVPPPPPSVTRNAIEQEKHLGMRLQIELRNVCKPSSFAHFINCAKEYASLPHKRRPVVDSVQATLIRLLRKPGSDREKKKILEMKFGPHDVTLFIRCLKAVQQLCLPESFLEQMGLNKDARIVFGVDIPYVSNGFAPDVQTIDANALSDIGTVNKNAASLVDFPMYLPERLDKAKDDSQVPTDEFGLNWLISQIKVGMHGDDALLDSVEYAKSIIHKLKTVTSDVEIQYELFEMLGFERFEMIQNLLLNTVEVIEKCERDMNNGVLERILREGGGGTCKERTPSYQTREVDVTPQSKIDELYDQIVDNIATAIPTKKKATYPHVYDAQREAKMTSGFIANQRLALPENVRCKISKKYEEVTLPIPEKLAEDPCEKPVYITELNPVGRQIFQGIKKLNRIQSIVFDTVYNSNDNLLICAPTGAGKTNVALLAVAREVEQHMEESVVQKDAFKIVYVAPMKALAAEMTENFSKRLGPLGLIVKEFTGDMQLTKSEIVETQMLITTPEKWDVVTRKGTGDIALTQLVKLLIIDEVHLLHGDRGPVVEALVARTLRQVESSQSMIRIVGLSATLPNYVDVARFLRVNPEKGLFFFDSRFRPVPLEQTFIGLKALKPSADMDSICYEKAVEDLQKGFQVMVFVHARNATLATARVLKDLAAVSNHLELFRPSDPELIATMKKCEVKLRNKQVAELLPYGISCHHAGMLRSDRNTVESCFANGIIKVLVCTATLAWGVNLPAHTVIIKGTDIYNAKEGKFVDLGILDVLQIFGRAGRPQFEASGHGIIITAHKKLHHYLSLLTEQFPIESNFVAFLAENLNAEIVLGTISNVNDAIQWLSYTYLVVRMRMNPVNYGLTYQEVLEDPTLRTRRFDLVQRAARALDAAKMIRYNERTGDLNMTDLGRIASYFYIKYATIEIFNKEMKPAMDLSEIVALIAQASEFEQLKARQDEEKELDDLCDNYCEMPVEKEGNEVHRKVNILLQSYLSWGHVESFSLISDQSYIMQNAVRIARALFEIAMSKRNALMASRYLLVTKMLELRMWDTESPLKQFEIFGSDVLARIEKKGLTVEMIRDLAPEDVGGMLCNPKLGRKIHECAMQIPHLSIAIDIQPITRTVLRIRIRLRADFKWNDRVHGKKSVAFWMWVEEPDSYFMYHSEFFLLTRKQVMKQEEQELIVTISITEPPPAQYYVRVVSDTWMGGDMMEPLSFANIILPEVHPPHTDLLPLEPLPVSALDNPEFEKIYNFSHFNAIQTQIFHCLYYTDKNVLLGAPTGSGKTIAAEIAIFRVFREYPKTKVVYIAPLKALVRERIRDWKVRFGSKLGKNVVELTGDVTPDIRSICRADVIVTTPEKWDGISRSWQTRNYVRDVSLVVIDEIHLLGEDRGPVLEVIVSRMNFITCFTSRKVRIIGLSTALANAKDLADWLGIGQMGLYNFRPSVRPVPLEVHVAGFSGKHYCPRMATMNRPTFQAIRQHSPNQPALVFVSSRRQTRLTALDLLSHLAAEDNPMQWLHTSIEEMNEIISYTKDSNLKLTLAFGIGLHHGGLGDNDRKTVEGLFKSQKIQVLIATATLAWGVNFPAHLVVIKGTEYYDGKVKKYVDMPITDVLQMMGRAGRPQFDDHGVAVVLVHDIKKGFYKRFLYEPFPVESSLLDVLPEHLNAEVVAGTIRTKQEALDYLTWTFFFRRLLKNPTYYNLEGSVEDNLNGYFSSLVEKAFGALVESNCVEIDEEDNRTVRSTSTGRIASFYYLSHMTMRTFRESIKSDMSLEQALDVLSNASEYDQLPVRHNEDIMNGELSKSCPLPVNQYALELPSTKAQLLFQAHFSRLSMPCSDYLTDLKSVLDQAIRILQAMVDVSAEQGWLVATLRIQQLMQMVIQASWIQASPLLALPHVEESHLSLFSSRRREFLHSLPSLRAAVASDSKLLFEMLKSDFSDAKIEDVRNALLDYPDVSVGLALRSEGGEETTIPQPVPAGTWLAVKPESEYTLVVTLKRTDGKRGAKSRAPAPRFPRTVDEGWFLTLGCIEWKEVIALKRAGTPRGPNESAHNITFYTPSAPGRHIYTLYVLSSCYIGFDQQFSLNLEVVER